MWSFYIFLLGTRQYLRQVNIIQHNFILIRPSLQSSEVHTEAGKPLESVGRAEEVSFELRAKYSLGEKIADMRW